MPDPSALTLALLVLTAFFAGAIDAIAGGGGLLTMPALLSAGVPAELALGTNKGQSVFGSATALLRYLRADQIDRPRARLTFPAGLIGAIAGAALVTAIDPKILRPLVLVLLVLAGTLVTFRRPKVGKLDPGPTPSTLRPILIALSIGAYDGFFGPGTGTFLIIAFVELLGATLPRATADAKVVNFASNLASVAWFALHGVVLWKIALPMACAQALGGVAGAQIAVKGGAPIIRRMLLAVTVSLVLKLGFDLLAS
jgi:uncharacterized membrane protein YfcA